MPENRIEQLNRKRKTGISQDSPRITIRVPSEKVEKWETFRKNNRFDSKSALIRYAVDEYIEKFSEKKSVMDKKFALQSEIEAMNEKVDNLINFQENILKTISDKLPEERKKITFKEYRKNLIMNLLTEKPRDENEINKIMDDLPIPEILTILNELMEFSMIGYNNKNKYFPL